MNELELYVESVFLRWPSGDIHDKNMSLGLQKVGEDDAQWYFWFRTSTVDNTLDTRASLPKNLECGGKGNEKFRREG